MAEKRITYTLEDVARILLKHENIDSGYWEIGLDFEGQSVMSSRGDEKNYVPTLMLRLVRINLVEKPGETPASIKAD